MRTPHPSLQPSAAAPAIATTAQTLLSLLLVIALAIAVPLLASSTADAGPARLDFDALPTEPVSLGDGWTGRACNGEAPLLCTSEGGQPQGLVEHLANPLETYPQLSAALADGVGVREALLSEVRDFHDTFRADRIEGCPDGYDYVADPTRGATLAGQQAVQYGFTVLDADRRPVERVVTFLGVTRDPAGDTVHVLSASELADGACVNAEDTVPFTDGGLGRFLPTFAALAARADLGPGSRMPRTLSEDVALTGDAVGSAIELSQLAVAEGEGDTVLLARHDDFADALASGGLQGAWEAPLLLTAPDRLDDRVAAELDRLGARTVVVLGGPAAISEEVAQAVRDGGHDVQRIAGSDRIATALAIADALPAGERIVMARAFGPDGSSEHTASFADALAAGALAAAEGIPVLLTPTEALDDRVADWIDGRGLQQVVVAGGESAIGPAVLQALVEEGLGLAVADGAERAETAVLLNRERHLSQARHSDVVVVVDGGEWRGGLSAALLASRAAAPVVLVDDDTVPVPTRSLLDARDAGDLRPRVVCTTAVTATACEAVIEALDGPA